MVLMLVYNMGAIFYILLIFSTFANFFFACCSSLSWLPSLPSEEDNNI